jgi:hypothetical protein
LSRDKISTEAASTCRQAEGGLFMPTVSHAELKSIIKESVKEALEEEMIRVRLLLFPEVSDKEMLDISDRYGKPEKKSVCGKTLDI